jgi:DNA polymerase I-like protein with 3'-5' exonuclease and polymerase domains
LNTKYRPALYASVQALMSHALNRDFVSDIETDGLLEAVTVIHSAVLIDAETEEVWDFEPAEIPLYLQLYAKIVADGGRIVGHNFIGYDAAVIEKLHGIPIPPAENLVDTVCLAKLLFSDIKASDFPAAKAWKSYKAKLDETTALGSTVPPPAMKAPLEFPGQFVGMHSLEAWGYRLGSERKGDYSKEMKDQGLDPWASWNPAMHDYMIQDGRVNLALFRHLMSFEPSPQSVLLEMRVQRLCSKIERNGWPFNVSEAERLYQDLTAERERLSQDLRSLFPPWVVQLEDFIPARDNKTKGYVKGVPVPRFETIEFNPSSRDHIIDRLKNKYGWVPRDDDYTDGGKPKVDDDILKRLPYPEAKALARYFLIQKRIGQLGEGNQAWLRVVSKEGKIHGRYNTNGASTGRATHYNPNISQVPSVGAEYGRDCRALFTVPRGWRQIGADQAGLELRCLGSFIAAFDGGKYIEVVLNGDIHWENAKALFGLPDDTVRDDENPQHKKMRNVAKTFIYAFLYGAGDAKLGSIVGKGRVAGAKLRARFLTKFPALKKLIAAVQSAAKKGWLKGLDGRKLPVRSEHSALNTLLQSAGAIICKQWIADAEQALVDAGLKHGWDGDFAILGWVHDELQVACRAGLEDQIAAILVETARRAGDPFPSWRCPTDGDAKIGANWAECH